MKRWRVFRGRRVKETENEPESRDLSELSERLKKMRGDNVTIVDSGGNIPPNRDAIENMSKAARDARVVDRSNDDAAISDLGSYRDID